MGQDVLKLQQLLDARTAEEKQAELDRQNDPMRRTFNILAHLNRDLNGDFRPVAEKEKDKEDKKLKNH